MRLAILALMLPALASAQPVPLGHHRHDYQTSGPRVSAQGWDPSFSSSHQADKDRWTRGIETYSVGLPGNLEPGDLGNTGCPANTTIQGAADLAGLPTVTLSGVGAVPLINDCNRSGAALKVWNGMKVAVHGSAFRKIDYSGGSTAGSRIFVTDSLFNADADENAAILCAQAECNLIDSEVLGGDDGIKGSNGGLYTFGLHVHGMDRTGSEHIDGIQMSPGADNVIMINTNIESPPRTSNAPFFAATNTVLGTLIYADGLLTGGTNPFKLGAKSGHFVRQPVLLRTRLMGDARNISWAASSQGQPHPCYLGNSSSQFRGEGNSASDGSTSGTEDLLGRAWDFSSCNRGPVPQEIKDRVAAKRKQLETWRDEIRAAVGKSVPDPDPDPDPTPDPEPAPPEDWTFKGGPYASGSHGDTLRITLGGVDNNDIDNMAGTWSRAVEGGGKATLTATVAIRDSGTFEVGECVSASASLGGKSVEAPAGLCGVTTPGLVPRALPPADVSLTVDLAPGTHTLALGGALTAKTYRDEIATVDWSDVRVEVVPDSGPDPDPEPAPAPLPASGDSWSDAPCYGVGQSFRVRSLPATGPVAGYRWVDEDGDLGTTIEPEITVACDGYKVREIAVSALDEAGISGPLSDWSKPFHCSCPAPDIDCNGKPEILADFNALWTIWRAGCVSTRP